MIKITLKQWNDHQEHMDEHIAWPANKKQILAACAGTDVDKAVLAEIERTLPDDDKQTYTKEQFKNMLVM